MVDRSYLAVTLNEPPDPLPPAVARILGEHEDREGATFIWTETALDTGDLPDIET